MLWMYKTAKVKATGGFLGGKFNAGKLEVKLNELGKDGWELSTSFTTNKNYGETRDAVLVFKRSVG
ncbi:hypothetical protein STSP2_00650 [Anaerohalosphaera lusitana]|uniref:DUF4177 domain-containing protein n=1 Tax=Anaerohalosphaera lusitana TaxID=1936003 RepID=A0A1U9NHT5_9BACT|nr:DUF4177 domain-containing protein [Anaerohalosphaera lusitana]AQT67502.1 hypothetical protein STSP2_00650 [Anaerohalosphaera lusitana]